MFLESATVMFPRGYKRFVPFKLARALSLLKLDVFFLENNDTSTIRKMLR